MGAHLIDLVIIFALLAGVFAVGGLGIGAVAGDGPVAGYVVVPLFLLTYVGAFASAFCYRWLCHAKSGQTLGKRALGIQVVARQTLHDKTADTIVIEKPQTP
ncbi:putative RDD family membrane protein YckC [Nocardiopsis mwathae]|uniref:Putative RDD family membrane protein YckC n=1 Tax=Nocardiopsis mwathae TaxID=1472723 RepID=A0A7X0D6P9_9ACTN|nr:putative RDD family membrane protein YckC [Nocardiopsis mwathae]